MVWSDGGPTRLTKVTAPTKKRSLVPAAEAAAAVAEAVACTEAACTDGAQCKGATLAQGVEEQHVEHYSRAEQ